jgi:hypothetical protein
LSLPPETRPDLIENPYYFATKAIVDLVVQSPEDFGFDEPVGFIFDEESEKARVIEGWDWMRLFASPESRKYIGDPPIFRDDKKALPLQMADLYAWWIRKWESEQRLEWQKDLPFPWGAKRPIRRVHMRFTEPDFLHELKKLQQPEILSRMYIRDPKPGLLALEKRERGIKMTLPDPSSPLKF